MQQRPLPVTTADIAGGLYVNAAQTADIAPYPPSPMLTFI
jgi:hypothetical protein